ARGARTAVSRAGAPPAAVALRHWRRHVSAEFSLEPQYLFLAASFARRARCVLLLVDADTQCDARRDGGYGILSFGTAVRSRGLGRAERILHAGLGDPRGAHD